MKRKALFPISLSNQSFSTSIVVPAIDELLEGYDEITFLVADRLQSYNRATASASALVASGVSLERAKLFRDVTRLTGTFDERRRWLEKVKVRLGRRALSIKWTILSIDDVADRRSFAILRNLDILFGVDEKFRGDVTLAAGHFAERQPKELRSVATLLSTRYIIEELALSVRMRVQRGYYDEYYIGETLRPALELYRGSYMASAWEIGDVRPKPVDFRFYELRNANQAEGDWSKVEPGRD